ncbi:MAG: hypothetical protein Q9159_002936 [Coniocarpon cinnabarinum]
MRLFLLPISTRRTLIYCAPPSLTTSAGKPSLLDRAVLKANETWASWEKDTESVRNWKKRTTEYGNMAFRRIPYEEWGLKSIPPSQRKSGRLKGAEGEKKEAPQKVQVLFPGLYQGLCKESMSDTVRRLATERRGLHRQRMWYSIAGMPLTLPFGLLPIIPNIPFFYLAFRAYSHWKALRGSDHLNEMLSEGRLEPQPSSALDNLYTAGLLYPTRAASRDAPDPTLDQSTAVVEQLRQQTSPPTPAKGEANVQNKSSQKAVDSQPVLPSASKIRPGTGKKLHTGEEEVMLLQGWNGKLMAERFKLPGLEVEIERAVEQVENSIHKSEGELVGEKKELEDLTRRFREKPSSNASQGRKA